MVLLPGCKCCGPCWRCYGRGGCDNLIFYWAKVIPQGWQDAFCISGNGIDTDTQSPHSQGNTEPPSKIEWRLDSTSGMYASYYVRPKNAIIFSIFNNRYDEPGLLFNILSCIDKDGEQIYAFQLGPANDFPVNDKWSLKHTATDGKETVWNDLEKQVGLILRLPTNEDSAFFTGKYTAHYIDGNTYSVELRNIYQLINRLSTDYEYQCFDAKPTEDGWVATGDCSATEAECADSCGPWQCYRKLKQELCQTQNITATLEVISVSGFNGDEIDTSDETGLPVGTKFNLESTQPLDGNLCQFYFNYVSPITGPCGPPFTGATTVGVYADLSGNQLISNEIYGRGNDAVFLGDQQLSCGGIPNNRDGKWPWNDSRWGGFGKHRFTVPIVDFDTFSRQIGEIVYEIDVIDLSGDDPDIPEDLYNYQCFDAPPEEDGWIATGDSHPDEPSCAEECPPEDPTTPPGARAMTTTKTTGGPGTELSKLLKMIGINAKEKGCSCKSHAKRMDREGPQWCRDNIETILGWLQTEAKKRKLPFVKAAAKQVVLLAIRRAERGQ